jgi:hypothetical protein
VLGGVVAAIALAACRPVAPPPPPGVAVGQGFDTCAAPSASTMAAWTGTSGYGSIGIYLGGQNRGCSQQNLTASWVSTVTHDGWRLAPLYVGLQAPCNAYLNFATMSTDPTTAYNQGVAAADQAVSEASGLGLGGGTPIYFDMEAYNCGGYGSTDTNAVMDFVNGWVLEIANRGYVSGYYSSAASGIADQVTDVNNGGPWHWPNDIWFADWNSVATTTNNPYIPNNYWVNQRLHQYMGGHNETHGGATLDIDSDANGGQLAG